MSHLNGRAGKRLTAAFNSLLKKNDSDTGITCRFTRLLAERDLNASDFQVLADEIAKIADDYPVSTHLEIFVDRLLGENALFTSFGFMMSSINKNRPELPNLYVPMFLNHVLGRDLYMNDLSTFPVRFNAEHTAFRFIQRTGTILDATSPSFHESMQIALLMAQSFGDTMPDIKPRAILVPHDQGLFVGYTEAMPANAFRRQSFCAFRDDGEVHLKACLASDEDQPFSPTVLINLNSFYDVSMCNRKLMDLRTEVLRIVEHPDYSSARYYATRTHLTGSFNIPGPSTLEMAGWLYRDLQDLFQSPDWDHFARKAQANGHVPMHSTAYLMDREI